MVMIRPGVTEEVSMKVESILKAKGATVETIRPDAPTITAVHRLASLRIAALVVSADGKRADGIISERDIIRGLVRHGTELFDVPVSEAMSKTFPTCSPGDPILAVMAVMTRTRNRHVPVVDGGTLCGLVSIGDVVKHRLDEMELEARVLRDAYIARR